MTSRYADFLVYLTMPEASFCSETRARNS